VPQGVPNQCVNVPDLTSIDCKMLQRYLKQATSDGRIDEVNILSQNLGELEHRLCDLKTVRKALAMTSGEDQPSAVI